MARSSPSRPSDTQSSRTAPFVRFSISWPSARTSFMYRLPSIASVPSRSVTGSSALAVAEPSASTMSPIANRSQPIPSR